MEMQELFMTFFMVLVALFLQELARRMTQNLSKASKPVTYLDFVNHTIFSSRLHSEELSLVVFTFSFLLSYMPWIFSLWLYITSIPKIDIMQFDISIQIPYFVIHFWFMSFIALSVFVPYWAWGLYSFHDYEKLVHSEIEPTFKPDDREYHRRHYWNYRLLIWEVYLILTIIVALLYLIWWNSIIPSSAVT